jgi:hypothetical protein
VPFWTWNSSYHPTLILGTSKFFKMPGGA